MDLLNASLPSLFLNVCLLLLFSLFGAEKSTSCLWFSAKSNRSLSSQHTCTRCMSRLVSLSPLPFLNPFLLDYAQEKCNSRQDSHAGPQSARSGGGHHQQHLTASMHHPEPENVEGWKVSLFVSNLSPGQHVTSCWARGERTAVRALFISWCN